MGAVFLEQTYTLQLLPRAQVIFIYRVLAKFVWAENLFRRRRVTRFQCRKPITERIPKKDVRNDCTLFEARKTIERETTTAVAEVKDARSAFDKLFK